MCAAAASVLVPLAAYGATLAPSVTWRSGGTDSGDVATAVATLGLPHPPGYPLFVVTGHVVARGLGWIEPARALNAYCALLVALGAAVVYAAARELVGQGAKGGCRSVGWLAALGATLALALGPLWWRQANHATPHAANALFAGLFVWLAARVGARPLGQRGRFLGGLVAGLAASHHLTLLALPVALVAARLFAGPRASWPRPAAVAAAAAGLGLGLTPWLLLPVIAARQPPHVWGDPTTPGGFLDVVLARDYRVYVEVTGPVVLARIAHGVRTVANGLGAAAPAAVAGAALLWDARRGYALFLLVVAGLELVFFALYAARDVEAYLLPVAAAAAPAAAVGIVAGARLLAERAGSVGPTPWVAAIGGGAVAVALVLSLPAVDLRGDREAIGFAEATLAAAPPRAVLVADDDRHTFALWYVHTALGHRPDVAVVDRSLALFDWYRAHVARRYRGLALPPDPGLDRTLGGRPVVLLGPPER